MNNKVLILVNHEVVIYNFRKELVQKLLSEGNQVIICCPPGPKLKQLKKMGCQIIEQELERRSINPIKDLKLLFQYFKIIKTIRPDMILTYTVKPNVYGGIMARLLKIPYIATITGLGTSLHGKSFTKKIMIFLYKAGLKKATTVFVQNQSNLRFLIKNGFDNEQLNLISGSGVNLQEFEFKSYPVSHTPIRFLFVGRVMREKGVYELLKAARELNLKGYKVEFHLAGFLDDGFKISDNEIPANVKFLGPIKDVRVSIEDSHAVILPSYHEGMSNALLEAAATGRPLIASNIPGCKEIIDESVNGYVFNVKLVHTIVDKLEKFINLPYEKKKKMGFESRKKVELEFSREEITQTYYHKILEVLE